jgi:hypothetical protein
MARIQKDKRAVVFRTVVILVIIGVVGAIAAMRYAERNQAPDKRNDLAQCLTDKGTKMYGAYWCPHCQAQKKLFGRAFSKVTYIECAVPGNPREQTQACKDANISGYPTWVYPDGSRSNGEQTLSELAEKSGCTWEQ